MPNQRIHWYTVILKNVMETLAPKYDKWENCTDITVIKQLLDEFEHDLVNYQNRGLCYLPKPKAEADNTDTRF